MLRRSDGKRFAHDSERKFSCRFIFGDFAERESRSGGKRRKRRVDDQLRVPYAREIFRFTIEIFVGDCGNRL